MHQPTEISGIRIITVSGKIGAGSTTLAKTLAATLGWRHLEGGEIFWEAVRKKMGLSTKDTDLRPDEEDKAFDERLKHILRNEHNLILETKLAGFNAKGIDGVYKILVVCEDRDGVDQTAIRIDRLVNREGVLVDEAKEEVMDREVNDLAKWRRLYAKNDPNWVYYDPPYYDLIINTFSHNQDETVSIALEAIGVKK